MPSFSQQGGAGNTEPYRSLFTTLHICSHMTETVCRSWSFYAEADGAQPVWESQNSCSAAQDSESQHQNRSMPTAIV